MSVCSFWSNITLFFCVFVIYYQQTDPMKSTYALKLSKVVSGGLRHIDSYYLVLIDSHELKIISKAMRNDEDNDDTIVHEIQPCMIEIWNYDKMTLLQRFKVDFKIQNKYQWNFYQENLEVNIQKEETKPKSTSDLGSIVSKENHVETESPTMMKSSMKESNKAVATTSGLKVVRSGGEQLKEKVSGVSRPPLPPKKPSGEHSEIKQ